MPKLGLQLPGFGSGDELYYAPGEQERYTIADMVRHAVRAEAMGFDFVCKATGMSMREPFIPFTMIAGATQRVRLMTSVIDVFTRSPIVAAKTVANLDEVSRGRFVLGIGRGALPLSRQEGFVFERVVQRLREYIMVVKHLFAGESVDFEGEVFQIREAKLGFTPYRREIPIYVGAAGPRAMRVAGELANGVFLGTASYAEYVRDALAKLREGAELGDRDVREVEVVGSSLLCVGPKGETDRYVKPLLAFFAAAGQVDYNLRFAPFFDRVKEIGELYRQGRREEAAHGVTDEMIDALAVVGSVEECREKVARFLDLGVNTYRVLPIGRSIAVAYENAFQVGRGL